MGERTFKIIVVGDSNVGKTCLTYRFCSGIFHDKTVATVGVDYFEKKILLKGDLIKLKIWDTAGQERFQHSITKTYYRNVDAVIFVYDVTSFKSYENIPNWMKECDYHDVNKDIPKILVGSKCDMIDKIDVNTRVAKIFADSHNMPFFEISAKDNEKANNIETIFKTLAHELKNSKPMNSKSMRPSNCSQTIKRTYQENYKREISASCGC